MDYKKDGQSLLGIHNSVFCVEITVKILITFILLLEVSFGIIFSLRQVWRVLDWVHIEIFCLENGWVLEAVKRNLLSWDLASLAFLWVIWEEQNHNF